MSFAKKIAAGAAALLLAAALGVIAQTEDDSPHGPLGLDCETCHNADDWSVPARPPAFDHGSRGLSLTGRHALAKCSDCHKDIVFAKVGSACADCHLDVHRGQQGPRCEQCHTPEGWQSGNEKFERHAARGFPLMGRHAAADCEACHIDQRRQEFVGAPVTCYGCHANDYAATLDPNHALAGFDTDCTQCHLPTATWRPAVVQHTAAFPLRNAHALAPCSACHAEIYAGTSPLCYSCHADDYAATDEPPHAASGIPTTCEDCHSDAGWGDGSFDHASATGFALTGAHALAACTSCHADGQWSGLPQECYGCHAEDYAATSEPDHAAAEFPTSCEACHTPTAWSDADFDHAAYTGFALTGAHVTQVCSACHAEIYAGTSPICYGCHADDYAATTEPIHVAADFPTTCETCHTTMAWQPSLWNHDPYFPINSGVHEDVWSSCATCHVNPNDYTVFECIYCHAHTRGAMDSEHRDVVDYEYLSTACYACHPNGRAD